MHYGSGSAYDERVLVIDNFQAVPEPAVPGLLLLGWIALRLARRRRLY